MLAFISGLAAGAVAASLVLALLLSEPADEGFSPQDTQVTRLTPDARFADFQSAAADAETFAWDTTKAQPKYSDVGGWVLWSPSRQAGYMVFEDLPPQDAAQQQYQFVDRRPDP